MILIFSKCYKYSIILRLMIQAELKKTISHLSTGPGIYIFKSSENKPLYIGKASSLRKRLLSYQKTDDQRILKMLSLAKHLKTLETGSEIEALILESQYIKKYQPPFNIMLRDDKQFFYVGFSEDTFPRVFITHQPFKISGFDQLRIYESVRMYEFVHSKKFVHSQFIGPFTDGTALKTALRYLRRIFPYCTCKKPHNNFCLNYHIGKCFGSCCLKESQKLNIKNQNDISKVKNTYQRNIKAVKEILSGKKNSLLKNLEKEMIKLGKEEKFEEAIELRSKIEKIKRVFENAKIINRDANMQMRANDANMPYFDSSKNHSESVLSDLKKVLGLKTTPVRIEGYDVANIQGKYAVGAMVVFINGKPDKNEYRKFKIKYLERQKILLQNNHDRGNIATNQESSNDIAMLKEVLTRRFNHPEWPTPDLILVDGGKAQLGAAEAALNSKFKTLNSKQIPIIALTKNERHKGEKIFIAGRKNPAHLSQLPTSVKNLLLHVDSEAHRFAISYYRLLHRRTIK